MTIYLLCVHHSQPFASLNTWKRMLTTTRLSLFNKSGRLLDIFSEKRNRMHSSVTVKRESRIGLTFYCRYCDNSDENLKTSSKFAWQKIVSRGIFFKHNKEDLIDIQLMKSDSIDGSWSLHFCEEGDDWTTVLIRACTAILQIQLQQLYCLPLKDISEHILN